MRSIGALANLVLADLRRRLRDFETRGEIERPIGPQKSGPCGPARDAKAARNARAGPFQLGTKRPDAAIADLDDERRCRAPRDAAGRDPCAGAYGPDDLAS